MVYYSQLIGEDLEMMYRPSVVDSPYGRAPMKAQDGILRIKKVTVVEIVFRGRL